MNEQDLMIFEVLVACIEMITGKPPYFDCTN